MRIDYKKNDKNIMKEEILMDPMIIHHKMEIINKSKNSYMQIFNNYHNLFKVVILIIQLHNLNVLSVSENYYPSSNNLQFKKSYILVFIYLILFCSLLILKFLCDFAYYISLQNITIII